MVYYQIKKSLNVPVCVDVDLNQNHSKSGLNKNFRELLPWFSVLNNLQ